MGVTSLSSLLSLAITTGERNIILQVLRPFIESNMLLFEATEELTLTQDQKDSSVLLVSGNLFSYLLPKLEMFQDLNVMGVVDSHCGGRLRNGRPTSKEAVCTQRLSRLKYTSWHRLRHSSTGGSTDFVGLLAYNNIQGRPIGSQLQHGIRHVFTAGIRPGSPPKYLPEKNYGIYYRLDDRLIPGMYHLPVFCDSPFHATGKGYRVLTSDELATAHGFPRHLVSDSFPVELLTHPPCQLLTASLDPVWEKIHPVSVDINPRSAKRQKETDTYFPEIKRHLPHDWIDETLITSTASKADDAALTSRLWDSRLELLFPGCTPSLDRLRLFLL